MNGLKKEIEQLRNVRNVNKIPQTGERTTGRPCREKESPSTRRFKWNETRKQIYIRSSMKLRGNREGEREREGREREHNMAKQGTARRGAVDGMGERSSVEQCSVVELEDVGIEPD